MVKPGRFVWNELNTRDAEAAKRFYGSLGGWLFESMAMPQGGTYWVAKSGDDAAAGLFTMAGPHFEGVPEHWLTYLEVEDVDRSVATVSQAGGTVIREPWTVPGVGRIAIVKDSGGAVLGLMTSHGSPTA